MLMVPITSAFQTANIPKTKTVNLEDFEEPEIYLDPLSYFYVQNYIEKNFEGEEKTQAYSIFNNIVDSDGKVDFIALSEAWEEYAYKPIPQEELNEIEPGDLTALQALVLLHWALNAFGDLIFLITYIIQDRLGWLHYVINGGYALCVDGVFLAIEIVTDSYDLLLALVDAVNLMLTVPQKFSQMINYLFNKQFDEFLTLLGEFTEDFLVIFGQFLEDLLDWIENVPDVIDYLKDLVNYVGYILLKPWTHKVVITGNVKVNFKPVQGALVYCKDQIVTTDSHGDFYIEIAPKDNWTDSFPANSFYGFHNFQITVEKDGKILKQSRPALSYACSAGSINWPIFLLKGKSKVVSLNYNLMKKSANLLESLYIPTQISKIDIQST